MSAMFWSRRWMEPAVAGTKPRSARPSVDLPLPLSPTTPTTSPRRSSRSTPSTALIVPMSRPNSRASVPPRSSKCTERRRTSTRLLDALRASGFVCNSQLLLPQWLLATRRDLVLRADQPAFHTTTARPLDVDRVLGCADVHRLRTARVEPASIGWVNEIRRCAGDEVQPG